MTIAISSLACGNATKLYKVNILRAGFVFLEWLQLDQNFATHIYAKTKH